MRAPVGLRRPAAPGAAPGAAAGAAAGALPDPGHARPLVVTALDLGTRCGWTVGRLGGPDIRRLSSGSEDLGPRRGEAGGVRFLRLASLMSQIHAHYGGVDMVFYELVERHKSTYSAHVYGGFQGVLMAWCIERGIPCESVRVQRIKQHATGSSTASKADMIRQAKLLGAPAADDNEADAVCLFDLVSARAHEFVPGMSAPDAPESDGPFRPVL